MKFLDMLARTSRSAREYKGDTITHGDYLYPCKQCRALTFFTSQTYNVRLCSTDCYDKYAQERV